MVESRFEIEPGEGCPEVLAISNARKHFWHAFAFVFVAGGVLFEEFYKVLHVRIDVLILEI